MTLPDLAVLSIKCGEAFPICNPKFRQYVEFVVTQRLEYVGPTAWHVSPFIGPFGIWHQAENNVTVRHQDPVAAFSRRCTCQLQAVLFITT